MIEIFLEDDEASLIYSLLNEIRKPVPKNLCPTFYRTLTYEGDVRLKEMADDLAERGMGRNDE